MNSIRPGLTPHVQPSATPLAPGAPRSAAQRAFFEIATGKTTSAAAPQSGVQTPAPAAASATRDVRDVVAPQGAAPARIPRPGSFLDIKV